MSTHQSPSNTVHDLPLPPSIHDDVDLRRLVVGWVSGQGHCIADFESLVSNPAECTLSTSDLATWMLSSERSSPALELVAKVHHVFELISCPPLVMNDAMAELKETMEQTCPTQITPSYYRHSCDLNDESNMRGSKNEEVEECDIDFQWLISQKNNNDYEKSICELVALLKAPCASAASAAARLCADPGCVMRMNNGLVNNIIQDLITNQTQWPDPHRAFVGDVLISELSTLGYTALIGMRQHLSYAGLMQTEALQTEPRIKIDRRVTKFINSISFKQQVSSKTSGVKTDPIPETVRQQQQQQQQHQQQTNKRRVNQTQPIHSSSSSSSTCSSIADSDVMAGLIASIISPHILFGKIIQAAAVATQGNDTLLCDLLLVLGDLSELPCQIQTSKQQQQFEDCNFESPRASNALMHELALAFRTRALEATSNAENVRSMNERAALGRFVVRLLDAQVVSLHNVWYDLVLPETTLWEFDQYNRQLLPNSDCAVVLSIALKALSLARWQNVQQPTGASAGAGGGYLDKKLVESMSHSVSLLLHRLHHYYIDVERYLDGGRGACGGSFITDSDTSLTAVSNVREVLLETLRRLIPLTNVALWESSFDALHIRVRASLLHVLVGLSELNHTGGYGTVSLCNVISVLQGEMDVTMNFSSSASSTIRGRSENSTVDDVFGWLIDSIADRETILQVLSRIKDEEKKEEEEDRFAVILLDALGKASLNASAEQGQYVVGSLAVEVAGSIQLRSRGRFLVGDQVASVSNQRKDQRDGVLTFAVSSSSDDSTSLVLGAWAVVQSIRVATELSTSKRPAPLYFVLALANTLISSTLASDRGSDSRMVILAELLNLNMFPLCLPAEAEANRDCTILVLQRLHELVECCRVVRKATRQECSGEEPMLVMLRVLLCNAQRICVESTRATVVRSLTLAVEEASALVG